MIFRIFRDFILNSEINHYKRMFLRCAGKIFIHYFLVYRIAANTPAENSENYNWMK
jgi:hypothetical protein